MAHIFPAISHAPNKFALTSLLEANEVLVIKLRSDGGLRLLMRSFPCIAELVRRVNHNFPVFRFEMAQYIVLVEFGPSGMLNLMRRA